MKHAFDDFLVDRSALELWRGSDRISIEPLVFDLLVYLIDQADRVVSKEELIDAIWNGRFVSDAAVASALRDLRRALGDDGNVQRYIRTMRGRGVRFVAPLVPIGQAPENTPDVDMAAPDQSIRFCRSHDGTRIAYATSGDGPPLLKTGHWLTHLEFDWESPVWRHVNSGFSETHRLVRYDGRGNGLSEWDISDFSLARQVEDLEAVADAAGLERFPILGVSQAAAFSIVYAAKHPERVSKLILYAGYEKGWRQRGDEEKIKSVEAMLTLMENQWSGSIAVAELISATYMPDAPPDHWQWFSDIQRRSTTGINAAALLQALGNIDVQPFLSEVKAPTLVLQGRNDGVVPLECGQNLAAGIPNAQFVGLDTRNHILHAGDPAWSQVLKLCREFLAD